MGCAPQFQKLYKTETKRLIVVLVVVLSVILVLQSSTNPYGNLLFSLLNFKSLILNHSTSLNGSLSTGSSVVLGVVNSTEVTNEREEIKKDYAHKNKGKDLGNDSHVEEQHSDSESHSDETMVLDNNSIVESATFPDDTSVLVKSKDSEQVLRVEKVLGPDNENISKGNVSNEEPSFVAQPFVSSPTALTTNLTFSSQSGVNSSNRDVSTNSRTSSTGKEATKTFSKGKDVGPLQTSSMNSTKSSTNTGDPLSKGKGGIPHASISEMNSLLLQSRVSSRAMKPRWSSVRDQELRLVKSQIESAPIIKSDPELYAPIYRNVSMYKRSYELMENTLKVYVYSEGGKPIFHQPTLTGIYASEGWFMKLLENNKQYIVKDPTKAHMFYLPFSTLVLRKVLDVSTDHHRNQVIFLKNYVSLIAEKHPFWNRTGGADHFLVACHDWALKQTRYMATSIRAICNANIAIGFQIGKDVSLPVTRVTFEDEPFGSLGGKSPSKRPFLAFFAGGMHGYVRPILRQYWENKDPAMKISGSLPRGAKPTYKEYMKSSKYCICARGYEVHTPRVVEAIFYECVPVIIADNYVPPFFELLNWETFSVFILEKDIPNLKQILLSIPRKRYLQLQMRVKKVRRHFLWHKDPVKHDIFHTILHSIWYNRVFQIR